MASSFGSARCGTPVLSTSALAVGLTLASSVAAQALDGADPFAGWLASATDAQGRRCTLSGERRQPGTAWLACGPAGVWRVALEPTGPRLLETYPTDGEAVGFFEEGPGALWVKLRSTEARPLDAVTRSVRSLGSTATSSPGAAPAALPPAPPTAPPTAPSADEGARPIVAVGRVLKVEEREVVISLGTRDRVFPDMHIELTRRRTEALGGGESVVRKELLAVGVVTAASEGFAKVEVGMNERITLDAIAEPTSARLTKSRSAPPRMTDVWGAQVLLRPFAAMGELGGGVLLSASIGYRFASSFHLQAVVDPLGLADVENKNGIFTGAGFVMASYDTQYIELGAGLGAQSINAPTFGIEPGSGLAAAQFIRVGALDGLNLWARTSVALFHKEFVFGAINVQGQIPVGTGFWLIIGGGGGDAGYGYGEFGLRAMLDGNGDVGSTFLTTTAGGAGVFDARCEDFGDFQACNGEEAYAGPMVGIGIERRF